jgi:isoleucyl-tRNA synthetase
MIFTPDIEEKILSFWKNNRIFEISTRKNQNKQKFVFIEGPPFANDKPHIGHFLTRIYKDVILRFKTMCGFFVERKAGWDTHGLPIEVATEKILGIKNKKEIINYGIEKFNRECKKIVMTYKEIWEKFDERIGFWIDHKRAYITYDPHYMISCWWIIKKIYDQGFLKEEFRVFPYCPRCETVLSQAEVGQIDAYKNVLDPDVYIKFAIEDINNFLEKYNFPEINLDSKIYLLVWTTTPWTLISNVAIAINPDLEYFLYKVDDEYYIASKVFEDKFLKIVTKEKISKDIVKIFSEKPIKGSDLLNISYKPLFNFSKIENFENAFKVYPADFVSEKEGTGLVHIAPAFGEEDFELYKKYNLPLINPINSEGKFDGDEPQPIIDKINGLYFKDANKIIVEFLNEKNLVFYADLNGYEHEYPHCWRCKLPLIYYATQNWVIKVSKFKSNLIRLNQKINWHPKEIGSGRFYEWIKEGKDWNLSRSRFWGIPLPIWKCENCGSLEFIDSFEKLSKSLKPNNTYIFLRHGESISTIKNLLSSYPETFFNPLTNKGERQIKKIANLLAKENIDLIITSPLLRCKQTSEIIAEKINVPIVVDFDLREIDFGNLNGKKIEEYHKLVDYNKENQYYIKPEGGENLNEVRKRMINLILKLEQKYEGKKILIVSHQDPILVLLGEMQGLSWNNTINKKEFYLGLGEFKKANFFVLPRNEEGEIDLHRPYVDKIKFKCRCGGEKRRIEDVVDIWFDSGAVPFASRYYPFENKKEIDEGELFPVDFIVEGVDQTRGWFYTLFVIGYLIKKSITYKNVVSLGLVLDKEGKKMSKSLGNVVDPFEAIKKWGVDVLRFYFFYVNESADNKKYNEEEILNIKNNYFDLLLNIYNFYKTYYIPEAKNYKKPITENILDKWFEARLKLAKNLVFNALENFNPNKAARELFSLVNDFSKWWLRRSRKRFQKPQNKLELVSAIIKIEDYLLQIIKLSAPLTPFFSEFLYQEIKPYIKHRYKTYLSIHLDNIEKPKNLSTKELQLLKIMEHIRDIISAILMLRKTNNLKIRQPLSDVYISQKIDECFFNIIKEEINVKKIYLGEPKNKNNYVFTEEPVGIWLNIQINSQLKEEGIINDLIRYIQSLRQDLGLSPKKKIKAFIETKNKYFKEIIKKHSKNIKYNCNLIELSLEKPSKILIERSFEYPDLGLITIYLV